MRNGPGDTIELSKGERHVLQLLGEGLTRNQIAREMSLNAHTVRGMIRGMCEAFDCNGAELPDVVRDAEADWHCQCGTVNFAATRECRCGRPRQEAGEHY